MYEGINLQDLSGVCQCSHPGTNDNNDNEEDHEKDHEKDNNYADASPRDLDQHEAGPGLDHIQGIPPSIRRKPVGSRSSSTVTFTPDPASRPFRLSYPRSGEISSHATSTQQNTPGQSQYSDWDWSETNLLSNASGHSQSPAEAAAAAAAAEKTLACPTQGDILTSPWSGHTIPLLIMSVFSTAFSAIFLGIAVARPRWGERIGTNGSMTYGTATLLSALFSKTVEISFVAVFVALLGQMLSRRAISKSSSSRRGGRGRLGGGVNLSEVTMRQWVTQPGTLVTHLHSLRHAALTLLGALVLVATVAATFYTTAAEALVAPKLKFGRTENRVLAGMVAASFGNSPYLEDSCQTPIDLMSVDPDDGKSTCLQISYAAQSFHNFQTYFANWGDLIEKGDTSNLSSLEARPPPFAMLNDNITVTGQWITPSGEDITHDSLKWGRLVENMTMAMPHANVVNAATNPSNHILQPSELEGSGEYYLSASVPAPILNILCVGMSEDEMEPLIYNETGSAGGDGGDGVGTGPKGPGKINATAVDDIFGFNQSLLISPLAPPPQFAKLPADYNTITNASKSYGTDAVWLLAKPVYLYSTDEANAYVLCSIKAQLYSNCTTRLHVTVSGGQLSVHCDNDPENTIPYSRNITTPPDLAAMKDWKDIGLEWQQAIALNDGISDANASIARLLTQFVPPYNPATTTLPTYLPSIGEALGVLAGSTALMASQNSPFVPYWNYSTQNILQDPQIQYFQASLKYMDYASGGSQAWQGIFYPVLVAVCAINVFALIYFGKNFIRDGQVTDYTEPQNLFALALMSPPTRSFSGSCGAGPQGKMLGTRWRVDMLESPTPTPSRKATTPTLSSKATTPTLSSKATTTTAAAAAAYPGHPHFYIKCPDDEYAESWGLGLGLGLDSGLEQESNRKRAKKMAKMRPKRMNKWQAWGEDSPAVEQYRRLSS